MKLDVKVSETDSDQVHARADVVYTVNGVRLAREDFVACALGEIAARLPRRPQLGPWWSMDGKEAARTALGGGLTIVRAHNNGAWQLLTPAREPRTGVVHDAPAGQTLYDAAKAAADACAAEWYDLP